MKLLFDVKREEARYARVRTATTCRDRYGITHRCHLLREDIFTSDEYHSRREKPAL